MEPLMNAAQKSLPMLAGGAGLLLTGYGALKYGDTALPYYNGDLPRTLPRSLEPVPLTPSHCRVNASVYGAGFAPDQIRFPPTHRTTANRDSNSLSFDSDWWSTCRALQPYLRCADGCQGGRHAF